MEEIKELARELLYGEITIETLKNEKEIIEKIINVLNGEEECSKEELEYLKTKLLEKQTARLRKEDMEFLTNLAEILRNQKVRLEDGVYLENPVYKVSANDNGKTCYYFLTKVGADNFIEKNTTLAKRPEVINDNTDERRKLKTFTVEKNNNLELERLLEIIKRNF